MHRSPGSIARSDRASLRHAQPSGGSSRLLRSAEPSLEPEGAGDAHLVGIRRTSSEAAERMPTEAQRNQIPRQPAERRRTGRVAERVSVSSAFAAFVDRSAMQSETNPVYTNWNQSTLDARILVCGFLSNQRQSNKKKAPPLLSRIVADNNRSLASLSSQ